MADRVVVRKSRKQVLAIALVGVLFVGVGGILILQPDVFAKPGRPEGVVIAFGVGILGYGLWQLFRRLQELISPPTLEISSAGFKLATSSKTIDVPWEVVDSFMVWRDRLWASVAWRLAPGHSDTPSLRVGPAPAGHHGSIGNGWEKAPEEIVGLFHTWREKHPEFSDRPGEERVSPPRPRW